MLAYWPVSFALKLAAFSLLLGVLVGVWVGAVLAEEPQQLQQLPAPTTLAVNTPPGQP
jgi:hypothetical protein